MVAEYATPLDIQNRAIVHLGAKLISQADYNKLPTDPTQSKNAAVMASVYDKLRRAELNRNVWRFSIRRAVIRPLQDGVLEMVPNPWSPKVIYERGAVASFSGLNWVSHAAGNTGIMPGTDNSWDCYFGPLTVSPYDNGTGYFLGENVYKSNGSGRTWVFSATTDASQTTSNSTDPSVSTPYDPTVYYSVGDIVVSGGYFYRSFIDANFNNPPSQYVMYNNSTTYILGTLVVGSDGMLYMSRTSGNKGNDPTQDVNKINWQPTGWPAPWIPAYSGTSAARGWIRQNCIVKNPVPVYPAGTGPVSQTWTRNVFKLPNGFLRRAPQAPKAGVFAYMGHPDTIAPDDYVLESGFLTSALQFPIPLRFAADIIRVSEMDHLFCEGLAARIALETCEAITQSAEKLKTIGDMYQKFMTDARMVNGIETGPTDPPEDEYIVARL